MIVKIKDKIYHDEHNNEISISNDNTKHLKVCKVRIRSDGDPMDTAKLALKIYKEVVGD